MFRALNEADFEVNSTQLVRSGVVQQTGSRVADRFAYYVEKGLSYLEPEIASAVEDVQSLVNNRALTYNQAIEQLYLQNETWQSIAFEQRAELDELFVEQFANETALHRVVGLAVEIRPDAVTVENLLRLRQLGCTKIQMGIQSLDEQILKANDRKVSLAKIQEAFGLLRVFGFKIHAHFMLNLYRSSPQTDILDYQRFVAEQQFCPDEVKLYPCALVESARLIDNYRDGSWQPYSEAELLEVLAADTLNTPAYVRISRMIRDFSATDIVAGNKKTNFRQMVEERIGQMGESIHEIRYREISTSEVDVEELVLDTIVYDTTVSKECFLQWVTPDNRIVGFLRLSLPDPVYVEELAGKFLELPIKPNEAMIREVHIYGQAVRLHQTGEGAQHLGLGRKLIDEAIRISLVHGYRKLNVISSVGTREYYRELGFYDNGLYQQKEL
jgi:elongator complex protein 3